ncbi:MAG: type IV-A pilus assembly ATPase PilB [Gammaproteobacteria bacterium]|nr:type IV-A pilus assembly ATPase PilB [Gammaproteobacteria bacterium]
MATPNPALQLSGLARRLVLDGLVPEARIAEAQNKAAQQKIPLVTYLVGQSIVKSADLARAASEEFGVPVLDLDTTDIDPDVVKLVDEKLVRKHNALPVFKRGNRLFLAVSDPTNLAGLDEIKFHAGMTAEPILVQDDKLAKTIEKALSAADTMMSDLAQATELDDVEFTDEDAASLANQDVTSSEVDDTPVVRFINKVLLDAINKGASDIHFEPYEKNYRVRLRLDGMLHEIAAPPVAMAPKLSARIKVMSRLDISERRVPQDGRIKLNLSKSKAIDFRVNTCPTLYGEKIVLRILDSSAAKLNIDVLGYEPEQKQLYLDALAKPYGMILVTGPTGSGKTVSLYTGVSILNQPGVNICTAEDPAEINFPGINQVNVNVKVGLTFATALRAFLRQDPDIILVGEIRDLETAEIAIKAAQTGHLVLSTLHTNDAPQTLTRLANMGVPPYNIASSVNLIIAQRLARKLCAHCKVPLKIPKEALLKEGFTPDEVARNMTIYGHKGCEQCTDGYKGRVGIYQVMPVSEEMGRIIMSGGNAIQLADQSRQEGIPDLRQSGLKKVKDGITSLEELNRVTVE